MPQQGERFLGSGDRTRARLRERRRRVFTVMLEGLGLTFLIGLFPPLRAMWAVTAIIGGLLGVYVWMLLRLRMEREAAGATRPSVRVRVGPPSAPLIDPIPTPQFPVVESEDGRRVVVISDPAVRRYGGVAG